MQDKFKISLTWHNCLTCPPEETWNKNLYISDGTYVSMAKYDRFHGYDRWWDACLGDYIPAQAFHKYWWADIEQTVITSDEFQNNIKENIK